MTALTAFRFGSLGDIHGDFVSARRIMERHPEVPFWLCVGDVADDQGRYEPLPAPLEACLNAYESHSLAGGAYPVGFGVLGQLVWRVSP